MAEISWAEEFLERNLEYLVIYIYYILTILLGYLIGLWYRIIISWLLPNLFFFQLLVTSVLLIRLLRIIYLWAVLLINDSNHDIWRSILISNDDQRSRTMHINRDNFRSNYQQSMMVNYTRLIINTDDQSSSMINNHQYSILIFEIARVIDFLDYRLIIYCKQLSM